jgi:hypothetical protein
MTILLTPTLPIGYSTSAGNWLTTEDSRHLITQAGDHLLAAALVLVTMESIVGYIPANNNMLESPTDFNGLNGRPPLGFPAAWTSTNASVTAPGGTRPDGTARQKLVENSTTSIHYLMAFTVSGLSVQFDPNHVTWRYAFIARAAERTRCCAFLEFNNGGFPNAAVTACFDLAGVQVVDTIKILDTNSHWAIVGAHITALANGYCLCTIDGTFTGAGVGGEPFFGHFSPWIALDNGVGLAPRNTSYTGDGTSGIFLWWQSLLPKGAWAINNRTFFDDFNDISTIDVNDTRAPGFNWYVHNLFPNTNRLDFGWSTNPPSGPTPPHNISVASSICTLTAHPADPNPGWESQLWSVSYTGDLGGGTHGYQGLVIQTPVFAEASFGYDAATFNLLQATQAGTVAFWLASLECLIGTAVTHFPEIDIFEAGVQVTQSIHAQTIWDHSTGTVPSYLFKSGELVGFPAFVNPPATDAALAQQHRYSILLLNPATNEGSFGLGMWFWDGHYLRSVGWSATTGVEYLDGPTGTPGGPVGTLSEIDTGHLTVFLNTCCSTSGSTITAGVPMYIDWVKIYKP